MEIIVLNRDHRKVPYLFLAEGPKHLRMLDAYRILDDDFSTSHRVSRWVILKLGGESMEFDSVEELQEWFRVVLKLLRE